MPGWRPCIQVQDPLSCDILDYDGERPTVLQSVYLGNDMPCCTWDSVSPPAPAATFSHTVIQVGVVCRQKYSKPTIAIAITITITKTYHCHDPTDAERGHDDVPWLILQLLIQPATKHLQRLIWCAMFLPVDLLDFHRCKQ